MAHSDTMCSVDSPFYPIHEDLARLPERCREFLGLMHDVALRFCERQGIDPELADTVSIFAPQAYVAALLGVHHRTVWRWLQRPEVRQVITGAAWVGDWTAPWGQVQRRNAGFVWAIKLRPQMGERAKLRREDFDGNYRNLNKDAAQGQTMHTSLPTRQESADPAGDILAWTIQSDAPVYPSVGDVCIDAELFGDAVEMDLRAAAYDPAAVEQAAKSLTHKLNDQRYFRFWCKVIWAYRRAGRVHHLIDQWARLRDDRSAGFSRRPAALFRSRVCPGGQMI